MNRAKFWISVCASAAVAVGCSGSIGAPGDTDGEHAGDLGGGQPSGTGGKSSGGGGPPGAPAQTAGSMPLQILTQTQYQHTLRDLFGSSLAKLPETPASGRGNSGFTEGTPLSEPEVRAFQAAAEAVAADAMTKRAMFVPCQPAANAEQACLDQFLGGFGKRVFRRPLLADEVASLTVLFKSLRTDVGLDFNGAIQGVLEAMLQSPAFLYRWELGPQSAMKLGALVKLTTHEIASRLSYFLTDSMPDADLFAAADDGSLADAAVIEKHARRLLASARADDAVTVFALSWADIERFGPKDTEQFSIWTGATPAALQGETTTFAQKVMLRGAGTLDALLTAPYSYVNETAARMYGLTNVKGAEFVKVDLDPRQRAGILTQPSVLAAGAGPALASPILRGKFVREKLLCQMLPAPPPNVPPPPATADPDASVREQFAQHSTDPTCAACHKLMDPLGFAFEAYDAVGQFRATENGKPVDARGTISGTSDADGDVDGAAALARRLAASNDVATCVARQLTRFALRRQDVADDEPALSAIVGAFKTSKRDFRELMVAIAKSQSFLFRSANPGEVL